MAEQLTIKVDVKYMMEEHTAAHRTYGQALLFALG